MPYSYRDSALRRDGDFSFVAGAFPGDVSSQAGAEALGNSLKAAYSGNGNATFALSESSSIWSSLLTANDGQSLAAIATSVADSSAK